MAVSILKAKVELNTTSINKGITAIRQDFTKLGAAGLAAGAVAIGSGLAFSVKKASELETGLAKIKTLLPDLDTGQIRGELQQLAVDFGIKTSDAVEGLYQTISAGVTDPAQALSFLRESAQLSVGGFVSLDQAVNAVSKTMNSYGLNADQAGKITDLLFQTVKLGQTDMDKLSSSVGQFTGLAKSLGLELDEVLGAFAQLTTTQGSTEKSATAIRAVFNALLKPSKQLDRELKSIARTQGDLKEIGLAATLNALRDSTNGNNREFAQLFSSQEALNGALALTGENATKTAEKIMQMKDAAGAAGESYDIVANTSAQAFNEAMAELRRGAEDIGKDTLPLLTDLMRQFGQTISELNESGDLQAIGKSVVTVLSFAVDKGAKAIKTFRAMQDVISNILLLFMALSDTNPETFDLKVKSAKSGLGGFGESVKSFTGGGETMSLLKQIATNTFNTEQKIPSEAI